MNLIFDTSVLIELDRGNKEIIEKISNIRKFYPAPAKISFISYFEFLYGLEGKSEKNKNKSKEFIEEFNIINTSKETANLLIKLKHNYEFPLADLLIASHAWETNGILVTKDKDFEKIKEIDCILI